ncbi:MAG TPA: protein kinase [Vicinamibacterales bacterium]|nr:protein kinase [Vicinamibacterales bacterium]
MIGKRILHYDVVRPLGAGGMGVVYEALDTTLGRRVALKFLPPELERQPQSLERFQREARAASALNHPNICVVHAIENHDGEHFIVMELLEGESLAQASARQHLDLPAIIDSAIQIADALESAHARGIVHHDIKPGNIFINARGQTKILDFGLAKIDRERASSSAGSPSADTRIESQMTDRGSAMGTVPYMSPEQARGQLTDARTDLFSLGTVVYQLAAGELPFRGDTSAVVFDAILNRDPAPLRQVNPSAPAELGRILEKALEKDRNLRYQSATDFKTDLIRLKRDLDSGRQRRAPEAGGGRTSPPKPSERPIAVLYFENLGGAKEDEYFRDGITEDIITELSKIKELHVFSRPTVLAYRDKPVTPAQIGQQLSAAFVLAGTLRRSGSRLRISAQLVDTATDFPVWSERYDRELQDVFELQDEIARKIAEALRVTLSPQEQADLAAKPTENLQAYDLYLRGKSYARRMTKQDLEFARQMFEQAAALDPKFALAYAAVAHACALIYYNYGRDDVWIERAKAASAHAAAMQPGLPEADVGRAWVLYAAQDYDEAIRVVREAIQRKSDCGGYYLLGRALFSAGRYQELADVAEIAIQAAGGDYNVYSPIQNALGALGKTEALRNLRQRRTQVLEEQIRQVPEDVRARIMLAIDYSAIGRIEDAAREVNLAIVLRPDEASVLYNAACAFCLMGKKPEALDVLRKARAAGFGDSEWARRDPDLAVLHGDPEFERLYPATT